ncbi:hypothetical protein Tco_1567309, partial [Tanacetum coccineum]
MDSGGRQRLANLQLRSAPEMWDQHPLAESCVPEVVKIVGKIKHEIEFGSCRRRVSARDGACGGLVSGVPV